MKKIRTWEAVFLCLTLLPFGTGCNAVQVRDRTYLQAIELQHVSEPVLQIHDFTTEGALASGTGKTIPSALSAAAVPVGNSLFLGHLELIAYQDTAFGGALEQLAADHRLSPACKVLLLSQNQTLEQLDTSQLTQQLQQAEENGVLPKTDLFTILGEWDGSSGTALLPILTKDGFSAAVCTRTQLCAVLSQDAVAGLCWLRDCQTPEEITLGEKKSYSVHSASVRRTASETSDGAEITYHIRLKGAGDGAAAAKRIRQQCEAAIQETVTVCHGDVLEWEACLWNQCYSYTAETNWEKILSQLSFSVDVTVQPED